MDSEKGETAKERRLYGWSWDERGILNKFLFRINGTMLVSIRNQAECGEEVKVFFFLFKSSVTRDAIRVIAHVGWKEM